MIKKILIILALTLFALTSVAGVAMAANSDNNVVLAKDTTHQGLYRAAGETIRLDGTVTGDAWVAGSDVTINGEVDGTLYAAASNITINGVVRGNLMLAGSKLTINGKVNGSAYLAGSDISLTRESAIAGSMVVFGSQYSQSGSVGTQAYLFGSQVKLDGPIGSNTKIYASDINITSDAKINGNLAYTSDAKIIIANDKNISGSVTKIVDTPKTSTRPSVVSIVLTTLFGLAAALILGLVAFSLLPSTASATAKWEKTNLAKSILYGVAFAFLVPLVLLLALLSLVGYQVAILGLCSYIAVLMLGGVMSAYCIGQWLLKRDRQNFGSLTLELLTGLAILAAVGLIPFVGALVGFFAAMAGVGAIVGRNKQRWLDIRARQLKT